MYYPVYKVDILPSIYIYLYIDEPINSATEI